MTVQPARRNHSIAPSLIGAILFTALGIAGCSSGSSGSTGTTPPPPIMPAATATTLAATPLNLSVGSSVSLSATVKLTSGSPASGTVNFVEGTTTLGSATLDTTGAGSLALTSLAVGAHSVTAAFQGSTTQAASTSSAVTITVTGNTASNISVSSVGGNVLGSPMELVAHVGPASGTGVATGTVTFTNGSATVGTAQLDPAGNAMTTSRSLPSGTTSIAATYNSDGTYASSTRNLAVTVGPAPNPGFTNPLKLNLPNGNTAVSCADPAIIKAQANGRNTWYLYCTSDALYSGDPVPHYINVFESTDLVNWTYDGNAFSGLPSWSPKGPLWAPAIKYFNGQYYLYYASPTSNVDTAGGPAIGVGVSSSPKGPFVDHGSPVVEPEPIAVGGHDRSTIDPDVVQDSTGQRYITFGSFDGGIFIRKLSADGFTSDKASETQLTAVNRYEGGALWQHGSYWYLFASSTNCCNGPFTGYSVFVGRASSPTGPFLDDRGVSMADVNAGGEEVLAQTGNHWIGPGGNVLFTDEAGQDYILYHAVPDDAPVYAGTTNYTARPALIDTVDWDVNSWPVVNRYLGPSSAPQPAPAAQPGATNAHVAGNDQLADNPGNAIASLSDEFNSATLSPQWSTLHAAPAYTLTNGALNIPTVSLDSCCQMSTLPMLVEDAPATDYIVETRLTMNLPTTGSGNNFAQGDLFIYGDDQNFLRLDLYSNANTRQVEFIKQATPNPAYAASNGASNLAEPSLAGGVVSVYLRIVKRTIDNQATYTAYTIWNPSGTWQRGATWKHTLTHEKIGLAASNLTGYTASFDYVHVSTLQ